MSFYLTTKQFIEKAKEVHGDKYDYSKAIYKGAHDKIEITCPIHGSFFQTPDNHKQDHGCPKCAGMNRTTEDFIKESKKIHGNKYDYSKVIYEKAANKIEIICSIHGSFWQTPSTHLQKHGCPKCGIKKRNASRRYDNKQFIEKAKKVHGNKYDYSKVEYKSNHTKICIICPEHGEFWQKPSSHQQGNGCPKCGTDKMVNARRKTIEEFTEKVNKIHNNKYDYSKIVYKRARSKVEITCPIHGSFWQTPDKHQRGNGCPKCLSISKGEKRIKQFLVKNKIKFEQQKKFPNCKNVQALLFDFYLPNKNMLIEYDGAQHYRPVTYFGGKTGFQKTKLRDRIKNDFTKDNNINLIRIKYTDYDKIDYHLQKAIA